MPFIESARLELEDDSSGKIKKINSELSKLVKTANNAKKAFKGLDFKGLRGLAKVSSDVNKVASSVNKLAAASSKLKNINMRINAPGLQRTTAALRKLRTTAGKPITQNVRVRYVGQRAQNFQNRFLRNRTQRVTQLINFKTTGISSIMRDFARQLSQAIVSGIATGFKEGYKTQDVADTRIKMFDMNDKDRNAAITSSRLIAQRYPLVSPQMAQGMYSEMYPIANSDPAQSRALTEASASYAEMLVELGATTREAIDKIYLLGKAGEQSSQIMDKFGKVDGQKVQHFFDLLRKITIQEGREMTPELVEKTFKSAQSSKFGLNDRGILMMLSYAAEMSSTAGVGLNQAIKNLSGHTTKEVIGNLSDMGLLVTKEVTTGKVGKKKSTQIVVDQMMGDSERVLRSNPLEYVEKYLLPAMRKLKLNPTDPVDASKFAYKVTSDRTAINLITSLLYRYQNISRNVDSAMGRNTSPEQQKALSEQSGLLAIQEASSQIQGLFGEIATSAEKYFIPALHHIADTALALNNWIAGPDDKPTEHSFARAGLLGALGLGGMYLGARTLNYMFNPLMGSAIALNGSAAALMAAARSLFGAGVTGKNPAGAKGPGWWGWGLGLLGRLSPYAAMLTLGGDVPDKYKTESFISQQLRNDRDRYKSSAGGFRDIDDRTTVGQSRTNLQQSRLAQLIYYLMKPTRDRIFMDPVVGKTQMFARPDAYSHATDIMNQRQQMEMLMLPRNGNTPGINRLFPNQQGTIDFKQTFDSGAQSMREAGHEVADAIGGSGAQVSQSIVGAAGQFGSIAGAAMAAAIRGAVGNIKLTTTPGPSTSDTAPADTGHVMGPH